MEWLMDIILQCLESNGETGSPYMFRSQAILFLFLFLFWDLKAEPRVSNLLGKHLPVS